MNLFEETVFTDVCVCVFPDDQTRVVLKNGVIGDYINANYVNVSAFQMSNDLPFAQCWGANIH